MPKFEANMNFIPPSPPSSMKQCNKSATVTFHMELLLTTTTRQWCDTIHVGESEAVASLLRHVTKLDVSLRQ